MFLDFIPTWIWGVILVVALIGVFSRNKLSNMLGGAGSILGLNRQTTLYVLLGLAVFMGGWGVVAGMWTGISGTSTASVAGGVVVGSTFGEMTLKIHDGLANATTTEDTIKDIIITKPNTITQSFITRLSSLFRCFFNLNSNSSLVT